MPAARDGSEDSDSWDSAPTSGTDDGPQGSEATPKTDADKEMMPRPTNEVSAYWRKTEDGSQVGIDLQDIVRRGVKTGLPPPWPHIEPGDGIPIISVRVAKVDTKEASKKPRGIESLDLHSLVDLHKQLERERREMPGELMIPGRIASTAVAMLVDSGATVSVLSTVMWEVLRSEVPGLTLMPTRCRIRTVSGELAHVLGTVVLEMELGERFYIHQFVVMDVEENLILGMDFIQKFQVDCDWRRGVLSLRGEEVQACRRYQIGDGRVRKLILTQKTVVPAYTQVVAHTEVRNGNPEDLPEWGMVSPARKPMETYHVVAGKALVDPRSKSIPIPIMNPSDTVAIIPRYTLLAFLIPIEQVGPPVAGDLSSDEDSNSNPTPREGEGTRDARPGTGSRADQCANTDCKGRDAQSEKDVLDIDLGTPERVQTPGGAPLADYDREVMDTGGEVAAAGNPAAGVPAAGNPAAGFPATDSQAIDPPEPSIIAMPPRANTVQSTDFSILEVDWGEPENPVNYEALGDYCVPIYCLNCAALPGRDRVRCGVGTYESADSPLGPEFRSKLPAPYMTHYTSDDRERTGQFYRKQWPDLSDSDPDEGDDGTTTSIPDCLLPTVPPHLRQLYLDTVPHVPKSGRLDLIEFLRDNQEVFAKDSDDLGRTTAVTHTIETGDARPIKQPPRRVPVHKKAAVQEEVEKMLRKGVIEPCDGPWASPIVLAAKKDGSTRFCVDFRRVNDVTKKDAYPLPRIEDNLDTLQGATYYSTLDLVSGFWQVEMAPEDRDKTAFAVGGGGLYRYLTMPFGLCNAPATFQRLMEHTLRGLQWKTAVLYIDDIIVFSNTVLNHYQRLGEVLDRLRQTGLKLKPEKCKLLRKKVEFLGHIVSAEGVEVDGGKISKISDWPVPTDLTMMRSFVGLCAYYRRYVPDFSTVCKPLFDLTRKGVPFTWGEEQQKAFETMKALLTQAPILGYPRPEGLMILDTDASNVGIGAVLSQVQDNEQERVLAYASKTLSKAERNYCVTRRELLAIVMFIKQFHHYLYGAHFLVRTDHAALYWLMRKKDPEGQMARWLIFLQSYDMIIEHRPGVRHGNADALSRCMEGCRDLDSLFVPEGDCKTLDEIKQLAWDTVRVITTRARAKLTTETKAKTMPELGEGTTPGSNQGPTPTVSGEMTPDQPGLTSSGGAPPSDPLPTQATEATPKPASSMAAADSIADPYPWMVERPATRAQAGRQEAAVTEVAQEPERNAQSSGGETQQQSHSQPIVEQQPDPTIHLDADALEAFFKDRLPEVWSDQALAYLQENNTDIKKVRSWFGAEGRPSWDSIAKENYIVKMWWARFPQLVLSRNGVLYIRWEAVKVNETPWYRVVAVDTMFPHVLSELHDAKTAGHLGQKKTIDRLKRARFYWPGMCSYARRWVQNCKVCAARKNSKHAKRSPLQQYRVGSVMDRVSIDLVGPFHPRTRRGNCWILTVSDQFSRWAEAFALRNATAPEVARKVVDFVCRKGMPLELHSDQGRNVDGEVMREVCRLLGIRQTHTTAYHPQGNAITERENSVIKAMLSAYVNERLNDWDDHLPVVMMAHRSAVHRTLQEAPFTMMMGRTARLPLDAMVGPPPEETYQQQSASEYVTALMQAMQIGHNVVSQHMDVRYAYQKVQYDRQVKAQCFKEAQPVWLRVFPNVKGKSKSLMKPWDFGWVVIQRISDVTYRIQKSLGGWAPVVHGDRLKPYHGVVTDPKTLRLCASLA